MILSITPNPAIDRTLLVPDLTLGMVHRATRVIVAAGGKGLNVARSIHILGGKPLCLGFAGGHAGRLLAHLAQIDGLPASWTRTNVETRTCTILVSRDGDATVINEPGLPVSHLDWQHLRETLKEKVVAADLVCVSGSLPSGSSVDQLRELLNISVRSSRQVWVDTSGAALDVALAFPGVCVKVNAHEISQSLGFEANNLEATKHALDVLLGRGLTACAITLGSAGALLAKGTERWHVQGPQIRAVSTVGSGDAFLGGLLQARQAKKDWPESLRDAVAAGTANALSAGGGQFGLEEFRQIRDQVQVQTW